MNRLHALYFNGTTSGCKVLKKRPYKSEGSIRFLEEHIDIAIISEIPCYIKNIYFYLENFQSTTV